MTGTATTSALTITTTKGKTTSSGQVDLASITVDGPLASFNGAHVNLLGLTGDDSSTIGGTATEKTTLTFNKVQNESLNSTGTISSLTATSWEGAGYTVAAPVLSAATIKNGDLAADLKIAGSIATLKVIGGNLTGSVNAGGTVGTISVSAVVVNKVSYGGDISGNITIGGADKNNVSLGSLTATGSVDDTILLNGGAGTVTVGYWDAGAILAAGVNPDVDTGLYFPASSDTLIGAGGKIGTLTLGDYATSSIGGTPFGIIAHDFGTITLIGKGIKPSTLPYVKGDFNIATV